jgi:tripartite ATP-independent transporter DctP family solute receptor
MKKFWIVGCMALSLVVVAAGYAGAKEIKINLGVVTKPGSAQNIVAEKFKELIEQRTGGQVTVKIYDSASLGSETDILQQVQMGQIQMAVVTAGPFDTIDPIVRVIGYPFIFKSNEQADEVLDGPIGKEILKSLEKEGMKGLGFAENGFRNLTNSRHPVKTAADVKGLKIRVMESSLDRAIWQALGANPTPMAWPIYTQLQQGVIDAQENPLWVIEVYKLYEVQKYMTMTRHVYSAHIDVACLKWWNALDAGVQDKIQKAIYEASVFQRQDNRSKDSARLAMLKEKGMQIEEHPDVDSFRAKVADLKDMDLFKEPRVKDLLMRVEKATK